MGAPKVAAAKHPRAKERTRAIGTVPRRQDIEFITPALPEKLAGKEPLASTEEAWQRLWSSDVAQVLELDSDLEAVVRWASLLDERERAFRSFRQQRLVEGSQGQAVISPLWSVVQACDKELRALEDRIGLSPKARLQLGITYAEAATSLDALNRSLEVDEADDSDIADPRTNVIDAEAS